MGPRAFHLKRKVLVLRQTRLGHLPPARYAAELLSEAGYSVLAVEYGFPGDKEETIPGKIPRLRFFFPALPWQGIRSVLLILATTLRISYLSLRQGKPLFCIAEGLNEQFIARLLNLFFGIPYLVQVHEIFNPEDLGGSRINQALLRAEGWTLRKAAFLLFPVAAREKIYRERYGLPASGEIVFNCPRKNLFPRKLNLRPQIGLPEDALILGYLGGIGRSNGIEETIQALPRFPNLHLILWGWGDASYFEKLKKLALDHRVAQQVHFPGQLPEEKKWESLASCDLSLCLYEPKYLRMRFQATASNKLFESLAMGVPVITSGHADFREFLERYDVGYSAGSFSPEGVAEAIQSAISNLTELRKKSARGIKAYQSDLNFEEQFGPVLQKLLKRFPLEEPETNSISKPISGRFGLRNGGL